MTQVKKTEGQNMVSIETGKFEINVSTMINGFQSTGFPANKALLLMLRDAINEFIEKDKL